MNYKTGRNGEGKTPFVTFAVFPFYLLDPVFSLFYTFLIQKEYSYQRIGWRVSSS